MQATVSTFRLPKAGNSESEYEDSSWPCNSCVETLPARIAVADGATDAVFSGLWAYLLVEAWGLQRLKEVSAESVGVVAAAWQQIVQNRVVPWYVEEKAKQGSYAAFIGVDIDCSAESGWGHWSATACGDCCLFQIREGQLLTAFPMTQSKDFSNSPSLLCTRSMDANDLNGIRNDTGEWRAGDSLYLMSDALACWFLAKCESDLASPNLLSLESESSFEKWIEDLRGLQELKNDDCTLVTVYFE